MISVPVELGERSYEVIVGKGVSGDLRSLVAARAPGARAAAIVTDTTVSSMEWFSSIDPGIPFECHVVPEGETAKVPASVVRLASAFARAGLGRGDVVVAVGGGVVTDLAGFAAAAYHRGTRYCSVATTLLAQVDAAIGGKTGVDLPEGKNLLGAIWQPVGVMCDTTLLTTLPEREWACGRAEMAKYTFLGAPDLLDLDLEAQVARCVELKASVVVADEREAGKRALLNYGHTLAHALEAAALARGVDVRHGEAVAVGLVYAAVLAKALGRIDDGRVAFHREVVARFGLSPRLPEAVAGVDHEELLAYMARDKKSVHDLTFVLDGPAGPEVVRDVPADAVREALRCI